RKGGTRYAAAVFCCRFGVIYLVVFVSAAGFLRSSALGALVVIFHSPFSFTKTISRPFGYLFEWIVPNAVSPVIFSFVTSHGVPETLSVASRYLIRLFALSAFMSF